MNMKREQPKATAPRSSLLGTYLQGAWKMFSCTKKMWDAMWNVFHFLVFIVHFSFPTVIFGVFLSLGDVRNRILKILNVRFFSPATLARSPEKN